jgi:hypothetical protein
MPAAANCSTSKCVPRAQLRLVRLLGTVVLVLTGIVGPASLGRGEDCAFQVEQVPDGIEATSAGKPVLDYRSASNATKPYVQKLYTPAGVQVLQDSPPDHAHHHGLMFALGVNDVNFWHETPGAEGPPFIGRQRGSDLQYGLESADHGSQKLVITQAVDWLGRENRPVVRERRRLTARCEQNAKSFLLTWTSRLSPAGGQEPIVLNGERYFGLGMRFSQTMPPAGTFLFSSDRSAEPKEGIENLIRSRWCAYVARENSGGVTVAMFGSPANRRHPTLWFTMAEPFAYLAATLDLHNRQLEIPAGETLELTYGIVAADGVLGQEEIERLYQAWLQQD